jgi:PKHD-type hydroxylase
VEFTSELRPLFVPDVDVAYEPAVIVPRAFTPLQCDRIIALGSSLDVSGAQVGARDVEVDEVLETRRSKTAWIVYDESTAWIYDKLGAVAARANRIYGFDLSGFTEDIQFTVYDEPDAFFDWHQDGLAGEVAARKLSMVLQLSEPDDYAGARLELFPIAHDGIDTDWSERAHRRGTVIVFPAFEHHRVTPLLDGTRHSLVCWIGGPPFR